MPQLPFLNFLSSSYWLSTIPMPTDYRACNPMPHLVTVHPPGC